MKTLFIDCPTGLAGDMLLAALIDLGVPRKVIELPLLSIGLGKEFTLNTEESRSSGVRGLRVSIDGVEPNNSPTPLQEIIAIIENYQQSDGSIIIPKVLREYTGFDKID